MMVMNLLCSECGSPLVFVHSSTVCSECGLVNDQSPDFIDPKTPLTEKIAFQPILNQFNENDIRSILKKPLSKKKIAIYTSHDSKFQEVITMYRWIISQFRDEPSYLQENLKTEYLSSLQFLRKKLNQKRIPSDILAAYIIAKQFNKQIKELEQYVNMNSRIGNLVKKIMHNQNTLPDSIDQKIIQKINIVREKIRTKTGLWLKPKIVGLITGLIAANTVQERNTKNYYTHIMKKKGLKIEAIQSI